MSIPYLCSFRLRFLSSFTMRASYAAWKKERCWSHRKPIGMRSRLMSNPAKRSEKSIVREPTRFARPVSSTAIEMKKTAEEAESEKRTRVRMNFQNSATPGTRPTRK